jgi:hypothetical protein
MTDGFGPGIAVFRLIQFLPTKKESQKALTTGTDVRTNSTLLTTLPRFPNSYEQLKVRNPHLQFATTAYNQLNSCPDHRVGIGGVLAILS